MTSYSTHMSYDQFMYIGCILSHCLTLWNRYAHVVEHAHICRPLLHIWYVGCVRAVAPGVPYFIVINVYIPKYHMRGIKPHNGLRSQAVDAN